MHAIFFTPNGLAVQVAIPEGTSINTRFYRKKVLRKLQILPEMLTEDRHLWYLFVT